MEEKTSMDYPKVVHASKNGKPIKIVIAEIPEDRFEDAADHMCTFFLADEAMCKSENLKDDPLSVQEFRKLFQLGLQDKLSVGAFVENPEGGKSILVGLNVLYLGGTEKSIDFAAELFSLKSEMNRRILQVIMETSADVDAKKLYGSDKYLGAIGLSVDPAYRGNSIGYHLLLARDYIGRKNKIPSSLTVFTSPIAAKLAERVGFTLLSEKFRDKLVDVNDKMLVPNCKIESFKYMGKRLM